MGGIENILMSDKLGLPGEDLLEQVASVKLSSLFPPSFFFFFMFFFSLSGLCISTAERRSISRGAS